MQAAQVEGPLALPALRQDLRILKAAPAADGRARWLLHDPVAGRFHRLGQHVIEILSGKVEPSEAETESVSRFLVQNKLVAAGLGADTLTREDLAARPSLGQLLVHKYLFFRIPLVRPQRFLNALAPWISFIFSKPFWILTALTGLFGLLLTAQQWDAFKSTFVGFLTLEGLLGYGAALVVIKALHELGHGFAAQRYGVRVPVMGVAFLVMFPVLYTDTTEGWAVPERRKRVIIDAAGMATELMIACFAIFAWSFLPDGPARQVAFFLATTSWTMSLLVNLNPCMRFDGYYLISDSLGVANLQATGFGLGKWKMRKTLLGWDDPKPPLDDADGAGLERLMLIYAYGTWVYRFFLFIGIAILVHHLFPKAIGIILFCVEILMFIALPISRELKVWASRRAEVLNNRRGRTSLAVMSTLILALCLPLSGRVSAPALISPAEQYDIFAPVAAKLDALHVTHNQSVAKGDLLFTLNSAQLDQQIREAELELLSAKAQLARAEATQSFREEIGPLRDALARAEQNLEGAQRLQDQLRVYAPLSGRVDLQDHLMHVGRHVGPAQPVMRVQSAVTIIRARVPDTAAHRLKPGAEAKLIVDGQAMPARLDTLAPVAEHTLSLPPLASVHGGPLMVDRDARGRLIPRQPQIAATLQLDAAVEREALGRVFIEAERTSVAARIWRRVAGVLIRETDF